VFLREERQNRCKQQSNEYPDGKLYSHTIGCLDFSSVINKLLWLPMFNSFVDDRFISLIQSGSRIL